MQRRELQEVKRLLVQYSHVIRHASCKVLTLASATLVHHFSFCKPLFHAYPFSSSQARAKKVRTVDIKMCENLKIKLGLTFN